MISQSRPGALGRTSARQEPSGVTRTRAGRGPGRLACRRRGPARPGRRRTACVCRMPARACSCRRRHRPRRAGPAGPGAARPRRASSSGPSRSTVTARSADAQGAQQPVDMGGGHERQVGGEDHDGIRKGTRRRQPSGPRRRWPGRPRDRRLARARARRVRPPGRPGPGPRRAPGRSPAASSTRATSGRPPTSSSGLCEPMRRDAPPVRTTTTADCGGWGRWHPRSLARSLAG